MLIEETACEYLFAGLVGPSRLNAEGLPPELKDKICDEASVSVANVLSLVCKTWKRHADRRLFRKVVIASKKGVDNWKQLEVCGHVEGLPRVVVIHREVPGAIFNDFFRIENVRRNVQQVVVGELTSGLIYEILDMLSTLERMPRVQLGMTWGLWPGALVVLQLLSKEEKLDALAVEGFRVGAEGKWEIRAPLRLPKLAIPDGSRGLSGRSLGQLLHSGWIVTSALRFFSVTLKQGWGNDILRDLLVGMEGLSELEIDARDTIGRLEHIKFRPMRQLKSLACQCKSSDLEVIRTGLEAMECSELQDLTLIVVNLMTAKRRELSKERLRWKELEFTLVHGCRKLVQLTVIYLHGTYRERWDIEESDRLWENHNRRLRRWLAMVRRRSTMLMAVIVRPRRDGWAVSAEAGDVARMFGPL